MTLKLIYIHINSLLYQERKNNVYVHSGKASPITILLLGGGNDPGFDACTYRLFLHSKSSYLFFEKKNTTEFFLKICDKSRTSKNQKVVIGRMGCGGIYI